jgi:hypothetical protein
MPVETAIEKGQIESRDQQRTSFESRRRESFQVRNTTTHCLCVSLHSFLFLFFFKDQKGIFSSISLFPPPRRPNFLFHSIANCFHFIFFSSPKIYFIIFSGAEISLSQFFGVITFHYLISTQFGVRFPPSHFLIVKSHRRFVDSGWRSSVDESTIFFILFFLSFGGSQTEFVSRWIE